MSTLLLPPRASGTTTASCRHCGGRQQVAVDAAGFRCALCGSGWRWAACGGCGRFRLLDDSLESWRCTDCHTANRSWWRTVTARREEQEVGARRSAEVAERRRWRARVQRHRIPVAVGVAIAVVVVALAAIGVAFGPPPTAERTRAACAAVERLRPALFNGAVGGATLRAELDELAHQADGANPSVTAALRELAAQPMLGGPAFEQALVEVADACGR